MGTSDDENLIEISKTKLHVKLFYRKKFGRKTGMSFCMHYLFAFVSTAVASLFPTDYEASIIYKVPFGGLNVPIHVDYRGSVGKQVIKYFDGLTTEIISLDDNLFYKDIFNMTDRICLDEAPEGDLALISIFPDLSQFNYTGTTVMRGLQCDHWTKYLDRPGEVEHFYYDSRLGVPVRWVMHARDEVFDSHLDDYVIDYVSLNPVVSDSWPLTPTCRDSARKRTIADGVEGSSHHLSKLRNQGNLPSLGYIARPERPSIQVFGNGISSLDIFDPSIAPPVSFDWRVSGGSPYPKDQAMCGSCYAFAVIGALESQLLIRRKISQPLSEQFVLDCGWSESSSSCSGGNQEELGPVLLDRYKGFVPFEAHYGEYMSTYSYCKNITGMDGIFFDGWVNLPARSSTELIKQAIVQNGLLSVSINAIDAILFHETLDGVVRSDKCAHTKAHQLNHAVNLVGWHENDYWILRNSWSTNWGHDGYFYVEMGDRDCGISIDVSFPIVKSVASEMTIPVILA